MENDLEIYNATVCAVGRAWTWALSLLARACANTDQKIKPGQSASVRIPGSVENAIVIPSISSVKEMGRMAQHVYENGVREVKIVTGMRTASSVEVVRLNVGDTLHILRCNAVRTGMR